MFFSHKKSTLGIDIGTANIKLAEVSQGQQPRLLTYGIVNTSYQLGGKNDQVAVRRMAEILAALVERSRASTKRCVISFPNSAVFSSVIEVPKMSEKDLSSAVEFEAKKYVPLPLSEVDLSWSIIASQGTAAQGTEKVLLTAVPKQVTLNYMAVFEQAGLEPQVGEIEALALIRALVPDEVKNCVIIDVGAKSTGLNIVENGLLKLSRNLNIGGDTVTNSIAQSLNITPLRAEQFKRSFGVSGATFIPETIKPVLNLIKNETKQLLAIYRTRNVQVDKVYLVGGGASLPGLADFFSDIGVPVELGNPLTQVKVEADVVPVVSRYALSLPVAIGLALRQQ